MTDQNHREPEESLADRAEQVEATQHATFFGVEPWPEPVNGAELLDELCRYFRGPVIMPEGGPETCALYSVVTHMVDLLDVMPYVNVRSETKRSGKSIVGKLFGWVVRRPVQTANASPASIFRQVDTPTLVIDEGDTFVHLSDETRGILNAGYDRDLRVTRAVRRGGDFVTEEFSPFGPKIICGIGGLPDTVDDRCIGLDMRRKKRGDPVDRFNRKSQREYREHGHELKRKIARWVLDNRDALDQVDPTVPDELHDRAQDNWEPLLMVAEVVGGRWPEDARRVAKLLSATEGEPDDELELLLFDVQRIFKENREYVHVDSRGGRWPFPGHLLTPTELAVRLRALEERPWSTYGVNRTVISTDMIGKLLGRAGVKSKGVRVGDHGGRVQRLYWPELFRDAWDRFETCVDCEELYEYRP